jgi:hypothetical protein
MDTLVTNLSQGGLALLGPQVDRVGTVCHVVIALPGEGKHLELDGAIVWSDESIPCMGFSFAELNREQRVLLANFLLARV